MTFSCGHVRLCLELYWRLERNGYFVIYTPKEITAKEAEACEGRWYPLCYTSVLNL